MASRQPMGHNGAVNSASFLKTRVSLEKKALIQSAAEKAYLSEAAWFRRAVDRALRVDGTAPQRAAEALNDRRSPRDTGRARTRVYVRLHPDDSLLLRDRAAARSLPRATYVSVLVRAHLRNLSPLPQSELTALKSAVTELGAIGRNLNQIARAANMSGRLDGPSRSDLAALLRVCESLRVHVKELLKTNERSWQVGHVEDPR